MNLPKRFNPDPTTFINIGENMLPLSVLTKEIQEEFAVLDKMKSEMGELSFRVEVLTSALRNKSQEIGAMVTEHLSSSNVIQKTDRKSVV